MKPDSTKPRSSDDSVLRDIRTTNQPQKSPLDRLDLATRHEIFYRKVDQGDPAQRESQEHQDLATRHESLRKDRQTYKIAHAYYMLHQDDHNNPANGDYNHFAETFNARQEEKFAKGVLRLELIKTSPDSGSSSPDKSDMNSDRSEKADHYAEISSEKQRKSANNRVLKKFMQFATAATYHVIVGRLDVATALPTSGYHRSWNDTSNNIGNISKRQLFTGTDFNNTAFLLQEVQSDPKFAWNAFQNKDFVNKALANQDAVNFVTSKVSVGFAGTGAILGGIAAGSIFTYYFARRARARQNRQQIIGQNVLGFNAAVQLHGPAAAAAGYAGIELNG